jgi:hypothetical protein
MNTEDINEVSTTEEKNAVFIPENLIVLIRQHHKGSEIFSVQRKLKIILRDATSAFLILYDSEMPTISDSFILDIQSRIIAKESKDSETNDVLSCIFYYNRSNIIAAWHIFPSSEYGFDELQELDFIFGQYTFYDNHQQLSTAEQKLDDNIPKLHRERNTNVLAKGLEGSGELIRGAIRGTGKLTGAGIRGLGKLYTSASIISREYFGKPVAINDVKNSDDKLSSVPQAEENDGQIELRKDNIDDESAAATTSTSAKEIDDRLVQNAMKQKQRALTVHSGARTITGAALYPVRWTGVKAAELASPGSNSINLSKEPPGIVTKAVNDTFGGLFNAVVSSFKGVTEAMGEIGNAVNETAINHAKAIHGDEYAKQVTQHYVDAAGEVGLASYKVLNVAAFGLAGIAADAAVEGATFLTCLSDFLVGPIILQGYMDLIQYPVLEPKRYFAVLRPWSLAFYASAADFARRPKKIIITAMLDTLPILRNYDLSMKSISVAAASGPIAPSEKEEILGDSGKVVKFSDKLRGGDRPHIEVCTVDCSTYLIYPDISPCELDSSYPGILSWYDELRVACRRVETVARHNSGADDIALERRLKHLSISKYVRITLKCCVLDALSHGISVDASPADASPSNLDEDYDEGEESYLKYIIEEGVESAKEDAREKDMDANIQSMMAEIPHNLRSMSTTEYDHNSSVAESYPTAMAFSMEEPSTRSSHIANSSSASAAAAAVPAILTIKSVKASSEKISTIGKSISQFHAYGLKALRIRFVPISEKGISCASMLSSA